MTTDVDNETVKMMPRIGTYSRHSCTRFHITGPAMARCLWPGALISGHGTFVLLIWCGRVTAKLYDTAEDAVEAMQELSSGCGARCRGNHSVLNLRLPEKLAY